ncbi:MAG: hypothetical protein JNK85_16895 [Verrucomicrobiales bacterium]|nr:hypothetical protein [Verrucomicrobiales bacterium]
MSATTRACFSGIGTYVLRLVATDGDPSGNPAGLTTSKDIEVVVELHAKHYLKSVVTPVNCGVQSFGPGLQNTHGSRSIRATIEVTTVTGQVPVPQVTIRTVTIAARQTWAAPCSSTLRLLSASYVDPLSSTSASDRSLATVKSSARLQWHPEIRSSLNQGLVELELTGTPGQLYRIEVSDDLNHWQPVMEWRATGGADQMRDQAPEGATARYYRVIESQESTDADVRSVEPTRE